MKRIFGNELLTVVTIMGLAALAMSLLRPMLPLYLDFIDIDPVTLGLMFSTAMFGMVIGESTWGWIADKIGIKIPLLVGTALCGLVVLCFLTTQNTAPLFAVFLVWGVVRSAIYGPGRGYIGTAAPPLKKATYMAVISVILSASRSIGALPGGFVVDTLGYDWLFYIAVAIYICGGMVVFAGLRKREIPESGITKRTIVTESKIPSLFSGILLRPLCLQCLIAAFQYLSLGVYMTFLPLLATQVINVSATKVGILFTMSGVFAMVIGIPMGIMADRIGKKLFMVLGLLITGGAMAGMAFSTSYSSLIVFVLLRCLGMVMFSPAALGLLSDTVPLSRQSTVMGLYGGICENTGVIVGSAVGGVLWELRGHQATFLTGTVSTVIGAIICFLFIGRRTIKGSSIASPYDCDCC